MANKTTWVAIASVFITALLGNLDRVPKFLAAFNLGVAVDEVAQAEEQIKLWQKHINARPVDIVTVELPKGRVVQCQPYPDGDTLVVSQDAAGESKSVWVPLKSFEASSSLDAAYAASQRVFIRKVCGSRYVFHKSLGRKVIIQILAMSNGRCVARLIDPARKGMVLSQKGIRCPRGCG